MALLHRFPMFHLCSFTHDLPQYHTKRPLLNYHKLWHFRCLASAHIQDERQSVNYQPSQWSHDFVQSLNNDIVVTTFLLLLCAFLFSLLISLFEGQESLLTAI